MSLDQIISLWPILVGVASVLYSTLTARSKVNAEQIKEIEAEHAAQIGEVQAALAAAKERLSLVEQAQHQLPTHADLTAIQGRISGVAKSVDEMRGEMRAGNRLLDSIHQVLLAERNQ